MDWKIFLTSLSTHEKSALVAALHDEMTNVESVDLSLTSHEVAMLANGEGRVNVVWEVRRRTQKHTLRDIVNAVDREIDLRRSHTPSSDTEIKL